MFLAIDTSGSETSVALSCAKQTLNITSQEVRVFNNNESNQYSLSQCGESHSSSLSNLVNNLLSENQVTVKDLDAIILGSGPGSFTGLRIGFAFAKGLAVAANIPIYAFSSLSAAAWQFRLNANLILVLDDARRSEFFVAAFSQSGSQFLRLLDDQIMSHQEVSSWLTQNPSAILVSPNANVARVFENVSLAVNLAVSLNELASVSNDMNYENFSCDLQGKVIARLAAVSPAYIRKVAALTIEERKQHLEPQNC